jgi:hypothetical protein
MWWRSPRNRRQKKTHSTEDVGEVNQEIIMGQSQSVWQCKCRVKFLPLSKFYTCCSNLSLHYFTERKVKITAITNYICRRNHLTLYLTESRSYKARRFNKQKRRSKLNISYRLPNTHADLIINPNAFYSTNQRAYGCLISYFE